MRVGDIWLNKSHCQIEYVEILNTRVNPLKQTDLVGNAIMYEANVVDNEQKTNQL